MKQICIAFILLATIGCTSEKQKLIAAISANEKKLFGDSTMQLNQQVALNELELYKKFATNFGEDSLAPLYLFKAADLVHGMGREHEALELYAQFLSKYPSHPKAAVSSFLEAFIYDTDLHQRDSAKLKYKAFLEKYPEHKLAPSAKAALDQLETGMSDDELVKMFEAKSDTSKQSH
jgi:outer membrane protein assembly factor BamD (BamD/ComL family)